MHVIVGRSTFTTAIKFVQSNKTERHSVTDVGNRNKPVTRVTAQQGEDSLESFGAGVQVTGRRVLPALRARWPGDHNRHPVKFLEQRVNRDG